MDLKKVGQESEMKYKYLYIFGVCAVILVFFPQFHSFFLIPSPT